jgi:hypothetical protein
MPRGYAEGPAAEAAQDALERGDHLRPRADVRVRKAVWGSTADRPEPHLIGYVGDVDPDELFRSGEAWGIYVEAEAG